jgi:hypothetical protein
MEAAQDALAGSRVVVLDEIQADARLPVPFPVIGFQEKTALVPPHDGLDPHHAGEGSFTQSDHRGPSNILVILTDMLRYTLRK